MNELRDLNLRHTDIASCPLGVPDQPCLTLLDLSGNRITRVPPAVVSQAIAQDRVRLWNNPLTDEDTLQRLIGHRQQTGINLWLRALPPDYGEVSVWLHNLGQPEQQIRSALWQRVSSKAPGARFLRVIDGVSLTPEYLVNYAQLQGRVWRVLSDADASDEMLGRLARDIEATEADADNPMAIFTALEGRARHYRDWVAMGWPIDNLQ